MGDYGGSILDPIARGMQLRAFIDDLKYKKELRERDRQLYAMDLEDRKRQKAMEDFRTSLALQQMGAIPSTPGENLAMQGLTEQLGPPTPESARPLITAPFNRGEETFRLPSAMDRGRQAQSAAEAENRLEYGKEYQRAKGRAEGARAGGAPAGGATAQARVIPHVNEETGEVTYDIFDREGNLTRSITKPGGTKKLPAGEKAMSDSEQRARAAIRAKARVQREYTPEVFEKEVDAYEKGRYQTLAQAEGIDWQYEQEAMGAGTRTRPDGTTERVAPDPEKARHVAQVKAQARKWAEDVVNRKREALEQAYTEEEIGNGPTSTSTASPAAKAVKGRTAGKVPVLKAANVAEAARRKGMSVDQFTQWFAAQGGVIQ